MNLNTVKTQRILAIVLIPFGLVLLGAAACDRATDDRINGNQNKPDTFADATNVTVYRNADNVPNVATFCVGRYGFLSTLSGGDSGSDKASTIIRFTELDATCR